jgi:HAD superfamily hydrolase (TIGR01549 family)
LIARYPVYVFDLDGTLVDSAHDICAAIQEVLAANGRPEILETALRRYIGVHLLDMFLDLGFEAERIEPMMVHYRRIYPERKHARTRVFPGVAEMLKGLSGRKSTATTKGTPMTRAVLEQFGLIQYFDHVQGTDGFPAKPEPDVIVAAMKGLGARPDECLLVGDAPADMEAGRRAGVRTFAVRWGYGDAREMARWEPDYWIDHPMELLGQSQ